MSTPECPASPIYFINPCASHSFDQFEGTPEREHAAAAFAWIVIAVFFLLNITYTCLINPTNSGVFKYLIKYLKKLDVGDSGVDTVKQNDVKFVIQRPKNAEGGVAVLIIVMAVAVLVGYVITSELDIPATVQHQRKYSLPQSNSLVSTEYSLDSARFLVQTLGLHRADLVLLDQGLFQNNSFYVLNGNSTCNLVVQNCITSSTTASASRYEQFSVDFWKVPNPIVTFCATKPLNSQYIPFAIRTGILPEEDNDVNLPSFVFGERLATFAAAYSSNNPPAVKVVLTATTSIDVSLLTKIRLSDYGIQKVRVDQVVESNFIPTAGCDNPVIQFQIVPNEWAVIGVFYNGVSTILISVFGAIGTVLGTRSIMKQIIQWISYSYQNSPKKRAALDITAYILQTIVAIGAFLWVIFFIILWKIADDLNLFTPILLTFLVIGTIVSLNAVICWIVTTKFFCRRRPCCSGRKGDENDPPNRGNYEVIGEDEIDQPHVNNK